MRRQGPHQGAEKSTRIGNVDFGRSGDWIDDPMRRTSCSNCSVDAITLPPDLATMDRGGHLSCLFDDGARVNVAFG